MKTWLRSFFVIVAWIAFFSAEGYAYKEIPFLFQNEVLYVSNQPESISRPGLVFRQLLSQSSLRLLYHHKNVSDKDLSVAVMVSNVGRLPVTVNVMAGEGGPDKDVIYAGHRATHLFWKSVLKGGDSVQLNPGTTMPVVMHSIKPGKTSSGVVRIMPSSRNSVEVQMRIIESQYEALSGFNDISSFTSRYKVKKFLESYRGIPVLFNCKDRVKVAQFGGKPYLKDSLSSEILKGNYGLVYGFDILLENPFLFSKTVRLMFMPHQDNSVDRVVFMVNGKLRETGLLQIKDDKMVAEYFYEVILKGNESKRIQLLMFPQAGCFYPVDILFRTMVSL